VRSTTNRQGTGIKGPSRKMMTLSTIQDQWIEQEAAACGLPFSEMLRRVVDAGRASMMRLAVTETENART